MTNSRNKGKYSLYNKSCYGLGEIEDCSVDALVTDPPYGISYQSHEWDKSLPEEKIWSDCFRVMKPGAHGLVFSAIKYMHHVMIILEQKGFKIKDVLMWANVNGMPKNSNIGLEIDKELGVESEVVGSYSYSQGYKKGGADTYKVSRKKYIKKPSSPEGKKYDGFGTNLKPAYEPVILIQKPIEGGFTIAENVIEYGAGFLNLESTRIPYHEDDKGKKIGHNPHPTGRVMSNIVRTRPLDDKYDKFFLIPKVRQGKEDYNSHPTVKPVELMEQLVGLVSLEDAMILDPFMGSGTTGVAALSMQRRFTGYEYQRESYEIAERRINEI